MFSGMSHHKGLECWPSMFYQCLNGLKKVFGKLQMPLERREREKKNRIDGDGKRSAGPRQQKKSATQKSVPTSSPVIPA